MPAFVKTKEDEKKWSEAKGASNKETDKGSKGYWKLANFIFHKMKKHQELDKAEELLKSLSATSVPNPMKAGEQTTISKTPKVHTMFKSEDFKDVKHPSTRKLRDFMASKKR
jgi:hypothetical protein